MNAKQARRMAEEVNSPLLGEVIKQIKCEAEQGRYRTKFNSGSIFLGETEDLLKERGFVAYITDYDKKVRTLHISW